MNNKIWVLTYTIGTNEGRKQRRLTCDTKEQAEMQQAVLGGKVAEYIRQPGSFKVVWPEEIDVDGMLEDMRKMQGDPKLWLELCGVSDEPEEDIACENERPDEPAPVSYRLHVNESIRELIVDEISSLIDDMSNHSPMGRWEYPGSPEWDCAKVETLNNMRALLNKIR